MIAKIFAVALLVLAASPLTQPFSTLSLGDLPGTPASHHSPDTDTATAALQNVADAECPVNPPVDVRPMERGPQHARTASAAPGRFTIGMPAAVMPAAASHQHRLGSAQRQQSRHQSSASAGPFAVLRL